MNALSTQNKEMDLDFIPQKYKEEFTKGVLEQYKHWAWDEKRKDGKVIGHYPDVTDIQLSMSNYYIIGCLYQVSGNPDEWEETTKEMAHEDIIDLLEDYLTEYSGREFAQFCGVFRDDICEVLDHLSVCYKITWRDPFSGTQYYSIENEPIVEVW